MISATVRVVTRRSLRCGLTPPTRIRTGRMQVSIHRPSMTPRQQLGMSMSIMPTSTDYDSVRDNKETMQTQTDSARPSLASPEHSVIADILQDNEVFMEGSAIGKGLRHATRHFLRREQAIAKTNGSDITDEAFYVCDLGSIVQQYMQWKHRLPRVAPYFAVKSNPDPVIVKMLARLGAGFDCASLGEITLVEECSADLPQRPDIIFANPCKQRSHIQAAVKKNVCRVTFDNADEIRKCAEISKDIELVLRIVTDDSGSEYPLSTKFGATRAHWRDLLSTAKECGLPVIGVAFHVGSNCRTASTYKTALNDSREIFDMGKNEFGFDMNLLDIGGGFPGDTISPWNPANLSKVPNEDHPKELEEDEEALERAMSLMSFPGMADQISPLIDEIFPEDSVRVMGEPGRYLVSACSAVVVSVTSVRSNLANKDNAEGSEETAVAARDDFAYYLNEGVYGPFNNLIWDDTLHVRPRLLRSNPIKSTNHNEDILYPSTIFGPTCDAGDVVNRSVLLPQLEIGDCLYYENLGAYTSSSACTFNGFSLAKKYYTCSVLPEMLEE